VEFLQVQAVVGAGDHQALKWETCATAAAADRWTNLQAKAWASKHGWDVGVNFIPSSAVNSLEMWQEATFDEATIDKELSLAKCLGMSIVRVFLHDLAFSTDSAGLLQRMDRFLTIAARHGISTMFVFFDGCWRPDASAGPQPAPLPNIHNSQWLQSPSKAVLEDQWHTLKAYVQRVISTFRNDVRVHSWDLYNEVDNEIAEATVAERLNIVRSTAEDARLRMLLLCNAFAWAREAHPDQPLHAGAWLSGDAQYKLKSFLRNASDIGSFHTYGGPEKVEEWIQQMKRDYPDRPLILTEYMARSEGSTFEKILPLARAHKVGAISWGLVRGKTNTVWPWTSWSGLNQVDTEPEPWFHDIFWPTGAAYDPKEAAIIRNLTTASLLG